MIDFHRRMLADTVRNDAFRRALSKVIVEGRTTVADIGAGTGLLSFFAETLGAKECTLYESGDIARIAKELIRENNMKHCHIVAKHSTVVKNPPRTDIVISETLGNYALEEHIIETLMDGKRFLKPGGIMIPCAIRQYVVPVTTDRFLKEIGDVWEQVDPMLTFKTAKHVALQNLYVRTVKMEDCMSGTDAIKQWDTIDFARAEKSTRSGHSEWKITSPLSVFGFCLFWEADLIPGITLSIHPAAPATHWEQVYVPVPTGIEVQADDVLTLDLHSDTRMEVGLNLQWKVSLLRSGKNEVIATMDMKKGFVA